MKPVVKIVESLKSISCLDAHRAEIRVLCKEIAACLRARKFVEGGNGEFQIAISDGLRKNSAIAHVTDSGQTIYISLIKLMGEVASTNARTYTFNSDQTRIHIQSTRPVTFRELRWCLKEFLRSALPSLRGRYGRTFSQLLDEEFYIRLQSECNGSIHYSKEEILKSAIKLYLSDKDVFSLSPRLRGLLDPTIDPGEHLIQAMLCSTSGYERRSRSEQERSTILPIEKLRLASGSLFKRLVQLHRTSCKGGSKHGLCISVRRTQAFLTVTAVRSDSNCISLRPSLMMNFPSCTLKVTWYSPTAFSIEKLTVGDWRHVLLMADTETRLDAKSMQKLTRRFDLIRNYLSGSDYSMLPPLSIDTRKIA